MIQAFTNNMNSFCNHLGAMNRSPEDSVEKWTVFQHVVHSSAASHEHPSPKHNDWFDENGEEIQRLLEANHRLHKAYEDDTSSAFKIAACSFICKTFQNRLRDMKDARLRKMQRKQSYANKKDMK